jgi:hypothetical protein
MLFVSRSRYPSFTTTTNMNPASQALAQRLPEGVANSAKGLTSSATFDADAAQPCERCTTHVWGHALPRLGLHKSFIIKPRIQGKGGSHSSQYLNAPQGPVGVQLFCYFISVCCLSNYW